MHFARISALSRVGISRLTRGGRAGMGCCMCQLPGKIPSLTLMFVSKKKFRRAVLPEEWVVFSSVHGVARW